MPHEIGYLKNREIEALPHNLKHNTHEEWFERLSNMYFYKNQQEVFDAWLITLNQTVYLSYNFENRLSVAFRDFILLTLPTNKRDKKRRVFKSLEELLG